MTTNADITLYNRKFDPDTRSEIWHRTIIRGVTWRGKRQITIRGVALTEEDAMSVRIPEGADTEGKEYLTPDEWEKLPQSGYYWTLQNGDTVFSGALEGLPETTGSLSDLTEDNPLRITITSVADNRDQRLSAKMQHWRVIGK